MSLFTTTALIVLFASSKCAERARGIEAETWRTGFRMLDARGNEWGDYPHRVVERMLVRVRRWHIASGVLALVAVALCVAGWVTAW